MLTGLCLFLIAYLVRGDEIPLLWQEQCAFSELNITGVEGQINHSDYRMRGFVMVFRHGERSGLTLPDDADDCGPFNLQDDVRFSEHELLVQNEEFVDWMGISSAKLGWKGREGPYVACPQRSKCSRGQLTAEGALQLIKLGEYMRERYEWMFGNDTQLKATVRTTNYNRTLQSAVALCSTFLYPHKERIGQNLDFMVANNTLICFDDDCQCPYVHNLWWRAHNEEYDTFLDIATPKVSKIVETARRMSEFAICREPHMIFDTAMTRYICRRKELPCKEGEGCLTWNDMNEILNFTTTRGWYWYNTTSKYMRKSVDDIKALNFLTMLFKDVSALQNDSSSSFIRLISGHDITIAAIFHSLGVEFPDPPRYTSRIMVEVFEKFDGSQFFRLIYNGIDYTPKLTICSERVDGLCPLPKLQEFFVRMQEVTKETRDKCFEDPEI